jgi:hypothetical protein
MKTPQRLLKEWSGFTFQKEFIIIPSECVESSVRKAKEAQSIARYLERIKNKNYVVARVI